MTIESIKDSLSIIITNGNYYVIHDTWAYTEGKWPSAAKKHIGKVVVSDLSLGEYSKTGSLLERLKIIRTINGEH